MDHWKTFAQGLINLGSVMQIMTLATSAHQRHALNWVLGDKSSFSSGTVLFQCEREPPPRALVDTPSPHENGEASDALIKYVNIFSVLARPFFLSSSVV